MHTCPVSDRTSHILLSHDAGPACDIRKVERVCNNVFVATGFQIAAWLVSLGISRLKLETGGGRLVDTMDDSWIWDWAGSKGRS